MRWLCDENVPRILVEALRQQGHDTAWIGERTPGIADTEVLSLVVNERRICLTFDKDFGELAANTSLPAECGIILLRVPFLPTAASTARLAAILDSRTDWPGHFSVVEPGRIRMRALHERSRR